MGEPLLAEALTLWSTAATPAAAAGVYAALGKGTVLLPVHASVVAAGVVAGNGLRAEKEAELSLLTVELGQARQVLAAFSSVALMRRWRLEARPVEVGVGDACRVVVERGWTGLLLDPGSAEFVLGPAAVRALADGLVPVAGEESVSVGSLAGPQLWPAAPVAVEPQLSAALRRGLAREPVVAQAWLLRSLPDLAIAVVLRAPIDPAGLVRVGVRLGARLGGIRLSVACLEPATAAVAAGRCLQLWP